MFIHLPGPPQARTKDTQVKHAPQPPALAKSSRAFVTIAVGGPVTFIVTFILMQLAFGADAGAGSGSLVFQVVGCVLFLVWLPGGVATLVGAIGTAARSIGQRRIG
jgi:hypothetical protein